MSCKMCGKNWHYILSIKFANDFNRAVEIPQLVSMHRIKICSVCENEIEKTNLISFKRLTDFKTMLKSLLKYTI